MEYCRGSFKGDTYSSFAAGCLCQPKPVNSSGTAGSKSPAWPTVPHTLMEDSGNALYTKVAQEFSYHFAGRPLRTWMDPKHPWLGCSPKVGVSFS